MPTSLTSHNSLVAHSRSSSSKSRRRRRRRRFRFSAAACGAPPRTPPPTPPPPPPPLPTTPPSPCRSRPPPTSTRSSARCPSPRRSRAEDRSGDRGQCHVFGHSFSFECIEAPLADRARAFIDTVVSQLAVRGQQRATCARSHVPLDCSVVSDLPIKSEIRVTGIKLTECVARPPQVRVRRGGRGRRRRRRIERRWGRQFGERGWRRWSKEAHPPTPQKS